MVEASAWLCTAITPQYSFNLSLRSKPLKVCLPLNLFCTRDEPLATLVGLAVIRTPNSSAKLPALDVPLFPRAAHGEAPYPKPASVPTLRPRRQPCRQF